MYGRVTGGGGGGGYILLKQIVETWNNRRKIHRLCVCNEISSNVVDEK